MSAVEVTHDVHGLGRDHEQQRNEEQPVQHPGAQRVSGESMGRQRQWALGGWVGAWAGKSQAYAVAPSELSSQVCVRGGGGGAGGGAGKEACTLPTSKAQTTDLNSFRYLSYRPSRTASVWLVSTKNAIMMASSTPRCALRGV